MRKYIFWGALFIIMGALWFLKMSGVISFTCRNILSLWPLLLIWIGIGILPLRDGFKIALDLISMAVGMVLLIQPVQGCSISQHLNIEKYVNTVIVYDAGDDVIGKVGKAKLEFNAGASEIIFAKGDSTLLNIGSTDADNNRNIKFTQKQFQDKVEMNVTVMPTHNMIGSPFTVFLSSDPVWEMDISVGASKNHIDLSPFKVENLELSAGASDIYLKIGDLHPTVDVKIEMGATNMEIAIPSTMDCHIKKEWGLTSSTFKDFKETGKGHYFSAATDSVSKGVINLEISSGVSNIVITKY